MSESRAGQTLLIKSLRGDAETLELVVGRNDKQLTADNSDFQEKSLYLNLNNALNNILQSIKHLADVIEAFQENHYQIALITLKKSIEEFKRLETEINNKLPQKNRNQNTNALHHQFLLYVSQFNNNWMQQTERLVNSFIQPAEAQEQPVQQEAQETQEQPLMESTDPELDNLLKDLTALNLRWNLQEQVDKLNLSNAVKQKLHAQIITDTENIRTSLFLGKDNSPEAAVDNLIIFKNNYKDIYELPLKKINRLIAKLKTLCTTKTEKQEEENVKEAAETFRKKRLEIFKFALNAYIAQRFNHALNTEAHTPDNVSGIGLESEYDKRGKLQLRLAKPHSVGLDQYKHVWGGLFGGHTANTKISAAIKMRTLIELSEKSELTTKAIEDLHFTSDEIDALNSSNLGDVMKTFSDVWPPAPVKSGKEEEVDPKEQLNKERQNFIKELTAFIDKRISEALRKNANFSRDFLSTQAHAAETSYQWNQPQNLKSSIEVRTYTIQQIKELRELNHYDHFWENLFGAVSMKTQIIAAMKMREMLKLSMEGAPLTWKLIRDNGLELTQQERDALKSSDLGRVMEKYYAVWPVPVSEPRPTNHR